MTTQPSSHSSPTGSDGGAATASGWCRGGTSWARGPRSGPSARRVRAARQYQPSTSAIAGGGPTAPVGLEVPATPAATASRAARASPSPGCTASRATAAAAVPSPRRSVAVGSERPTDGIRRQHAEDARGHRLAADRAPARLRLTDAGLHRCPAGAPDGLRASVRGQRHRRPAPPPSAASAPATQPGTCPRAATPAPLTQAVGASVSGVPGGSTGPCPPSAWSRNDGPHSDRPDDQGLTTARPPLPRRTVAVEARHDADAAGASSSPPAWSRQATDHAGPATATARRPLTLALQPAARRSREQHADEAHQRVHARLAPVEQLERRHGEEHARPRRRTTPRRRIRPGDRDARASVRGTADGAEPEPRSASARHASGAGR